MAKRYLTDIVEAVKGRLREKFDPDQTPDFSSDDIKRAIENVLIELSQTSPYLVKETVDAAASKDVDISDIDNLLEVEYAEYPVGHNPESFHNTEVRETGKVTLVISSTPTAGEDIYLYCRKVHSLTATTSTLDPAQENCLILGVAAQLANDWQGKYRDMVNETIPLLDKMREDVKRMAQSIEQSLGDIDDARRNISKTTWGNVAGQFMNAGSQERQGAQLILMQATGFQRELQSRLNISRIIEDYRVWANQLQQLYMFNLKKITRRRVYQSYAL